MQACPELQLDSALAGGDAVLGFPLKPPWLCAPPAVVQCTVAGVLHLLHRSALLADLAPGLTVVVGRSPQLGAPLARELVKADCTVVVCHSQTPPAQLAELCRSADLLVVAAGVPGLVSRDMVKPGAVVVNCGTTFCPDSRQLLPDVAADVAEVPCVCLWGGERAVAADGGRGSERERER